MSKRSLRQLESELEVGLAEIGARAQARKRLRRDEEQRSSGKCRCKLPLGKKEFNDLDNLPNTTLDNVDVVKEPLPNANGLPRLQTEDLVLDRELKDGPAKTRPKAAPKKLHSTEKAEEDKNPRKNRIAKRKGGKTIDAAKAWKKSIHCWKKDVEFSWPAGTVCIIKYDAKKAYGLEDKEVNSLPHEFLPEGNKRMYSLSDIEDLAKRKYHAGRYMTGVVEVPGEPIVGSQLFVQYEKATNQAVRRLGRGWYPLQ